MKIVIGYASFPNTEHLGVPLVSQNRQFQWFNEPTFIYPVIPAYAATMLSALGHEVWWIDGPAMGYDYNSYMTAIGKIRPDLMIFEAKTPVIKRLWEVINDIKEVLPNTKIIVCGDHV